jgi:intracellular multiplication protein IcmC
MINDRKGYIYRKHMRSFKLIGTILISFIVASFFPVSAFAAAEDSIDWQIQQVRMLLIVVMYIMGVFFLASAILSLKKFGQRGAFMQDTKASLLGPVVKMFIGVGLMAAPDFIDIIENTIWTSQSILQTESDAGSGALAGFAGFKNIELIVNLVGYFAFIRGWVLIVRSTSEGQSQPGALSKGMLHVFGGILAINIRATVSMLQESQLFA